jgi:hypothetical protein
MPIAHERATAGQAPKLVQVVRLALPRGHYSYRTEQSYLH